MQWRLALLDLNTEEAMIAYRSWNEVRDWSTPIAELREKFVTMMNVLVEAERLSAEARIAQALTPEPPKKSYSKNRRFGRGPAKGRSQKVDDRGFGTSKKSRLKRRRHSDHSELANAS